MGKRKHQILTDAERHFLIGIPDDRDELARRFTFESSDIDIIGAPRSHRNWLGLALQLALLRHPGMTLAQFVLDTGSVPSALTGFVAEQLGLPVAALADYAAREQTMTDHARKLAAKLGLRAPRRDDVPFMIEAGAKVAWGTDNGLNIAMGIVAAVRDAGILLPSIATIERAAIAGRARARKSAAHHLIEGLNDEQVLTLDQLFDEGEESGGATKLTWLKTLPVAAKADHVKGILDRLKVVRAIAIPADRAQRIHVERYRQYVREGRASPAYMVERYTVSRRQATLVACLIDLEERLTDAALDMADKLIGGIFTRARNAQAPTFPINVRPIMSKSSRPRRMRHPMCWMGLCTTARISKSPSIIPTPAAQRIMCLPFSPCWDSAFARAFAISLTGGLCQWVRPATIHLLHRYWVRSFGRTSFASNGLTCCDWSAR